MLAALRRAAVRGRFRVDELHGQPLPRVLRAAAVVVRGDARPQVLGYARVERAIGAADDVDVPANAQRPSAYNSVSLYMMKRPMTITKIHAVSEIAATTLALPAASPSAGTVASERWIPVK
jgi:hypothetical protein